MAALTARDEAIGKVNNFRTFNLANLSLLLVTGAPGTVDFYTSKLCSYRNDADPSDYDDYHHRAEVVINSPGTLVAICRVHYNVMYAHMVYLLAENMQEEAKVYCALLGRIALTTCAVMVVRDLRFNGTPNADQRRTRYLRQLTLPMGQIAPPCADLLVASAALPAGGSGVTPFPAAVRSAFAASAANKRARDDSVQAQFPSLPVLPGPVTRTLLYSEVNVLNVDAFDQRNRGYQFSVKTRREIDVASMYTMLIDRGCNAENPFHLFLAVPQDIFDDCIHAVALNTDNVPPPTHDKPTIGQRTYVNSAVHQYVLRIPKSIT